MTTITAGMVAELRGKTDAPMMECKKALTEAAGDMGKAEEILRVKLGSKAGKAASRIAAEGVVAVYVNGTTGAIVEVNSETDFVAKNDDFLALANGSAKLVAEQNPADVAALGALDLNGKSVEQTRADLIGKIGENMSIRRFKRFASDNSLAYYLHGAKIGVMVEFKGDAEVARQVAMHIAAARPQCVSADEVDPELVAKERHIYEEQAAQEGKPAEIVAKMVEGRVRKYLAEVTLLGQQFVMNPDLTIEKFLKEKNTSVSAFTAYHVGEGIEKAVVDYAAEVAAAAKI